MLDQYCMRCHTEGGQGGLSFEDPTLVQTLASVDARPNRKSGDATTCS